MKVGNGTVGTTAEKVTGVGFACVRGVTVSTPEDNTNVVYVGRANVSATQGFLLKAGMSQKFEIDSSDDLFIVGGAADQVYSWLAQ